MKCHAVTSSDMMSYVFQLPPPPECTDDSLNFCGEDQTKYPVETIAEVFNKNEDLKSAVLTLRKFFQPKIQSREYEIEVLDDLACRATRQKIPKYTRAKNVNGMAKINIKITPGDPQNL